MSYPLCFNRLKKRATKDWFRLEIIKVKGLRTKVGVSTINCNTTIKYGMKKLPRNS
ncbi:hypothetical protein SAMN05421824_2033 [Hyunsoonleella jejuensis]|uniref:Uncharacterized protein n=1 Tax=Hyunsoonleella jejuensis TaxID=419940 RepID=A0A1H9H7T3_9FLAO|nr:hypothetical protein [Hyunsoonleella jejuensis]SEQ58323.1 hypothetical protein SAMN05421824_2033 [Hyunsoonleella jejuensis]